MTSDKLRLLLSQAESHWMFGRIAEAKSAYERALRKYPKSTEARFQLAVLLHDEDDLAGAVIQLQELVRLLPEVAEVQFNLGTMLMRLGRKEEARESFRRAVELQPGMAEAHNNLGLVQRDLGALERAVTCFETALELQPENAAAWLNLGTSLTRLKHADRAVEVCRQLCAMSPDMAEAHFALGLALELAGLQDAALGELEEAVRRKPEAAEWRYHLAARRGCTAPPIAPAEYVASLFDAYAARFDEHLRGNLQYRTPEYIRQAVEIKAAEGQLDVLDLGCGTGLCGELFRSAARRLVGIDLSAEMIRAAESRDLYDELHVTDIVGFLRGREEEFDIILAADVFVYVGDLAETFDLVRGALKSAGRFAFSVEAAEEVDESPETADYHLSATRRYVHSLNYLRRLASAFAFIEAYAELLPLRTQAGANVLGWVVVLDKP
jgi:predicted TPR repeat methyltransferase